MEYTILAFVALIFYGMAFALCVMILNQWKLAKLEHRRQLALQAEIDREQTERAESYTRHLTCVTGFTDWAYLLPWLKVHLTKYQDGKLPAQSGCITYADEHVRYTLNFEDATSPKIEKYIRPCIKLLKQPKPKKVNVLKQANRIIRRRTKVIAGVC